jgi:alkylhydroperoxidase/carboxymuconolactone decarboxylase family protein YurZ
MVSEQSPQSEPVEPRWAAVQRHVFGEDRPPPTVSTAAEAAFFTLVNNEVWSGVWDRPGLDLATRRAITISVLIALGYPDGLALHVRGALADGMSAEEISEILLHCTLYCGVPAAAAAYRAIRPLLAGARPPEGSSGIPDP